jgi:2-iminoacetate synthase ThiH
METITLFTIPKSITEKVKSGVRISDDEALYLFTQAPLGELALLANYIREKKHGHKTFFNLPMFVSTLVSFVLIVV